MPFVETRFISPTALTTSAASALYTVPTGYSAIIKQLVVTNTTGTAATFTFYIGAASAGNALFSGTSVAANDTVIINLSQVLTTGETLRALASTGSALNLTVSGVLNDGPLASTATYIADNAITVNKIADGSVTTAKIADGTILNADINASAAIAVTKLAPASSGGQLLMGGASGIPAYITPSGDVTVDQSGVVTIGSNKVTQAKLVSSLSGITVTTSSLRASAIPSPFAGQQCYETDTNTILLYNGSAWVCITPKSDYASNQPTSTSTSFTTLTSDPQVSIQTGTRALVTISARHVLLGAGGYCMTGYVISGASSIAATDGRSIQNYFGSGDLGNDRHGAFTYMETGLTAGINTFRIQHRVTAGTIYATQRSITVVGIP